MLLNTFAPHEMRARSASISVSVKSKVLDYAQLTKMRLAWLVVLSALTGYFFALDMAYINWVQIFILILGGFMVTGSSNAFNQIIEKDLDKLMNRTSDRPLPDGRMEVNEAFWVASILGVFGVALLWIGLNPLSGILGLLALFLYVAIYTPLKRVGPIAVFVGAFPGAIPPMLGYVAATNEFGLIPGLLFATQFIWQFPHFWAIAWKADSDYTKAGFRLLPSSSGKSKMTAFYILIYALFLIPISLFPIMFTTMSTFVLIATTMMGAGFAFYAIRLYQQGTDKAALNLMLASFVYLPVVQLLYLI
ncbi:MAG: protoheme IX farnesyltransferase [Flavobacteriales bacterium]|nr:protoheme IX farnesyltransferase [Flavobacteriales bacterium]MBT6133710.1 protoheme IX farnesyltransferase [Flavobacteriales bacterium]